MNTIEIGLLKTPSKRLESSTVNVTEIKISFGGGMGGANNTLYGDILKRDTQFITFKDINSNIIELGINFIVSIRSKKMITTIFDTTAHANYNTQTVNKQIETLKTIHNVNDTIVFVDEYLSDSKVKYEKFSLEIDTEKLDK